MLSGFNHFGLFHRDAESKVSANCASRLHSAELYWLFLCEAETPKGSRRPSRVLGLPPVKGLRQDPFAGLLTRGW